MNQLLKSILVAVLVTFYVGVNGQLNYRSGYIINLQNDTVFGLVDDGGGNRNAKICLFKSDKKAEVVKYLPEDIKSYRFIGDKYYSSQEALVNSEYKSIFTEVLIAGKVNLYHSPMNNEMLYYVDKGDGKLVGLLNKKADLPISSTGLYGLQNDGKFTPVKSERFDNQLNTSIYLDIYKDTLFWFFKESEKVRDQLDSMSYTKRSVIKITKSFIKETCSGDDCILYEKDLSLSRPKFGVYSGVRMSTMNFADSDVKTDFFASAPIGIFCNVPMKRFRDGLSFQIEGVYNGFSYDQIFSGLVDTVDYLYVKSTSVGFPVLLKYELTWKKWSPTFAIGKETGFVRNSAVQIYHETETDLFRYTDMVLHRFKKGGWIYEAGMDYKVSPHFSIFSNLRFQSFSNLVLSDNYSTRASYNTTVEYDHYLKRFKTSTLSLLVGIKF